MRRKLIAAVVLSCASLAAAPSAAGQEGIPEGMLQKLKAATAFIKVTTSRGSGSGSGFLMKKAGNTGFLVTNAHVARPRGVAASGLNVVFRSGTPDEFTVGAQIVGLDKDRDLAILKVTSDKLPAPLDLKTTLKVRETLPVYILGYPFGRMLAARRGNPEITIARGSISSIRKDTFGNVKYLQIDGDINPGNSGGPIVDSKGALIGVSVAKLTGTHIGLAIPPRELEEMLLGRVSGVTLTQTSWDKGAAKFRAEIRLIDPMNQTRSVSLLLFPKAKVTTQAKADATGRFGYFYPNQSFKLTVTGGIARGEFELRNSAEGTVTYLMQMRYVRGDGKTLYTQPGDLNVRFSSSTAARPTPGPGPGPGLRPGPSTPPAPIPPPKPGSFAPQLTLGPAPRIADAKDPGAEGISFRLPDEVCDAALACGGQYLVLGYKVQNKLGVFDIARCKMHKEIPTPQAGVVMAAGGKYAVFYAPDTKTFEKWDVAAGKQVAKRTSQIPGQVTHMAMGLAEGGEAIISYAVGTDALDRRSYAMLDLSGFSHRDCRARWRNSSYRDRIHVRANPTLTAVTMWATSHSPTGFILGRRRGRGQPWDVKYEHSSYGALVPSYDGGMVFSSTGGVYDTKAVKLQNYHGSLIVPVQGTNMFMQIESDLTTHIRTPDMQDRVKFFKAPESAKPSRWERGGLSSDQRAIASGPVSRAVFVDNNALRLWIRDLGFRFDGRGIAARPGFELPGSGGPTAPGVALDPKVEGNRLPDQVTDVKVAYDGRYLVMRYKVQPKLGIFDVLEGRFVKEIPVKGVEAVVGAGGRSMVIYSALTRTFEKWDLGRMRLVKRAASRVDGQVTHLAMGLDEEREALISYVQGGGALDPRRYAMLDLNGFTVANTKARWHNSSRRNRIHIRANPALTAVTMWASSHSPSGFILGRRGGPRGPWNVKYEHSSFGSLNPTSDGTMVLASNGSVYGLQAKAIKKYPGSQLLPVHGADLFLQMEKGGFIYVRDLDFNQKSSFKVPEKFTFKIDRWARGSLYADQLVAACGRANRAAFIDNNALRIHVVDMKLKPGDVPAFKLPAPGGSSAPRAPAPAPAPAPDPAPQLPVKIDGPAPAPAPKPPTGPDAAAERRCKAWLSMAKNYRRAGMDAKAKEYLLRITTKYPKSKYAEEARGILRKID
ncbi:MAG: trypsin-like peptidase domain-containing protein [Planctomycetota bacterium]|jgi:hypothetical protein